MFFIDSCNFFVLRNTPSSSSFYEISCKISETWKIFPILHSAPRDNNCLILCYRLFYIKYMSFNLTDNVIFTQDPNGEIVLVSCFLIKW